MRDVLPVRAAAMLAAALGAGEADDMRELAPVDGVEPAVLGSDRHKQSLIHPPLGGNPCEKGGQKGGSAAVSNGWMANG